jgi:molecular chaperone DnaK
MAASKKQTDGRRSAVRISGVATGTLGSSLGPTTTASHSPEIALPEAGESPAADPEASGRESSSKSPARIAVGIDLGTTHSVIAHLDSTGRPWTIPNIEGDLITPSVILFDQKSVVVGKEAVNAAAFEPERVAQCVKREMGSPVYSKAINGERLPPEVIQSFILKKLKADAEKKLGTIGEVVITVPAFFNDPRRKATQDAGKLAGLKVIDIINEPTAAAIAYGVQRGFLTPKGVAKQAETILIYDLGGGTFDVTLMRIERNHYRTLATAGDVYLGGIDWDRRIVSYVAEQFKAHHHGIDPRDHPVGLQRLMLRAEEAKRSLSVRDRAKILFEHAGHTISLTLTRQEFESLTTDLLERTRFTTTNLLRDAGFKAKGLTRLLLVGGATRMPMVAAMLKRELRIEADHSLSVDEAVAHGAAIYAGLLLSTLPLFAGMTVQNVNSHNLGVLGIEPSTGRPRNSVVIRKNAPLPATRTRGFKTRRDDQRSVLVNVIEGGDASGNGSTPIGQCTVRDLPPGLAAGTPIEVTFTYQENGRLKVKARLPDVDREAHSTIKRSSGLTRENVAFWQQRLKSGLGPLKLDS